MPVARSVVAAQTPSDSFDPPAPDDRARHGTAAIEPLLSIEYVKLGFADLRHVVTAPARWDRGDWKHIGIATAGLVGVALALDEPIRDAVNPDPDRSYGVLSDIERLGEARRTIPLLGVFYLAGMARDDDTAKAVALDGLIARTLANRLVTTNLKRIVGRARPYLELGAHEFDPFNGSVDYKSFPSGHATEAFSVAAVITAHYEARWVWWLSYGLATGVAVARVKHDQHWTSDVLAGAIVGTAIGREVVAFNRGERDRRRAAVGTDGQLVTFTWEIP